MWILTLEHVPHLASRCSITVHPSRLCHVRLQYFYYLANLCVVVTTKLYVSKKMNSRKEPNLEDEVSRFEHDIISRFVIYTARMLLLGSTRSLD